MSKYSVSHIKGKLEQVVNEESYSTIDRIRLTAFHTNVAIVVIATLVHVFTGNHIPSMIPLSIATIVVSLFFTVLFVAGKISLLRAYIFNSICLQALLSLRIVLLVILQPEGYEHGVVSNEIGRSS